MILARLGLSKPKANEDIDLAAFWHLSSKPEQFDRAPVN